MRMELMMQNPAGEIFTVLFYNMIRVFTEKINKINLFIDIQSLI